MSLRVTCSCCSSDVASSEEHPQRVPFVQHFFKAQKLPSHTLFLQFDHWLLPIIFKPTCVSLPLHRPLHPWVTVFCLAVVVPGCPLFLLFATKAHLLHILACLLHIFRMSVEHVPNFLQIFSFILKLFYLLFTLCS